MFTRLPRIARSAGWMLLLLVLPAAPAFAQDDATQAESDADQLDPIVAMILELMSDSDASMRALAFDQIRAADGPQGEAATLAFAGELPNLDAAAQARLASALGQRGDAAAAPAIRDLLATATVDEVRLEAIGALGRLGDTSDLPTFIELIAADNADEAAAARQALVYLRGDGLTEALSAAVLAAPVDQVVVLSEILTTRRELGTIPALLEIAVSDNAAARQAAMTALGQIASPDAIPGMVLGVLKAERGRERADAEKNIMFVCENIEDPQERAAPVLAAMEELEAADQLVLLSVIGRIGGDDARARVEAAIASNDSATHAAGISALCNWPNSSVEGRLLELARTGEHPDHQRWTLRALIRIAPLADDRTQQHRLDVLRTAMAMAQNDDDRLFVLRRASAIKTVETFEFVMPYMEDPTFREQAITTLLELSHDRGLRSSKLELFNSVLEQIKELSTDPESRRRAQIYLNDDNYFGPEE